VKGGKEKKQEGLSFIHTREDRSYYEHDWLLEMRLRMALVDRKAHCFFSKKNYLILFFKSSFYFNFCFIFPKLCCLISFPTDLLIYVSEFLKGWLFRISEMLTLENF